jgi:hypothetical protein
MVKKKIRNPYLNTFDLIHFGISCFLENPNLPPSIENSCPLPQYLLQYALFPRPIEITSGVMKHIIPSQANSIFTKPSKRYVSENIQR